LKSFKQQIVLHIPEAVAMSLTAQLRQLQRPAGATTVVRTRNNRGKKLILFQGHQTSGRTAGEKIWKALFETRQPIADQKSLKTR
jgi:hypothetical protein